MFARRRPFLVCGLALFAVAASSCAALAAEAPEPAFPYMAYVADGDALVRSGPGRKHYAAAQLPAGYAVEVYRHDAGGWCAIRPPEGSFSLVPLRQVQAIDEHTAQVSADGVPARVGSALTNDRTAVQVILQRGETVGLVELPSPTNPWVRITPPAGEFRWIAARRLSRTPPTEAVTEPPATTPLGAAGVGWQSPVRAADVPAGLGPIVTSEPDDDHPAAGDPFAHLRSQPAGSQPAAIAAAPVADNPAWASQALATDPRETVAVAPAAAEDDVEIIPGSPAAAQQPLYPATGAAPVTAESAAGGPPRIRFEGLTAKRNLGPLDPRVAEMQLRLSQIVIGAPDAWQFGTLRDEATSLLAQEQTAACRDQLRDLLDRVAAFESIQSRYIALPPDQQMLAAGSATAPGDGAYAAQVRDRVQSDLGLSAADNGITPTPGGDAADVAALYDAVGTLKPVVSRRQNAPRFALIGDDGEVVTFVTAAPDVNLQAYVGQRVGVRGSRGFMPELRRAHVVASRVTNLENAIVK